jgi:tetratricopeptide (TPR) repeat protein
MTEQQSSKPPLKLAAAAALLKKGERLFVANKFDEALGIFDEIVHRLGDSQSLPVLETIAHAMQWRGLVFQTEDRDAEAIDAFGEIDRRFGNRPETSLAAIVAEDLLLKSFLLDPQQEMSTLDEIILRYSYRKEANIASSVAWALWSKGGCLEKRGQKDEALTIYHEVICRFGHRYEPSFPELLELAERDIQRMTGSHGDEISAS